jgi:hypothetical protein
MGTKKENVDLFRRVNEGYLHQIGPDGRYHRDRIFASLGIPPGPDGDYGRRFELNDKQRKQVQAAIEKELGFQFPGGIEIDPAGNMNENEGVGKWAKDPRTYLAIGGAVTGLGALGVGPLAGLFSGASGAGAAAAPTVNGVTSALPGAIASQGASAGIGAAGTATSAAGTAGKVAGAIGAARKTSDIAREVMSAIGSGAGDAADTMAHNRGVRMSAATEAEALNVARRRDDRDSRDDAMRAYQQAAYLASPDRGRGPGVSPYAKPLSLPPLDPAIVAARRDEAAKRLQTPYADFAFDPNDLRAGGMEKAANIASVASGIASAVPGSVFKKLGKLIGF